MVTDEQIIEMAKWRGCIKGTAEYYGFIEGARFMRDYPPRSKQLHILDAPFINWSMPENRKNPKQALTVREIVSMLQELDQDKMLLIDTQDEVCQTPLPDRFDDDAYYITV